MIKSTDGRHARQEGQRALADDDLLVTHYAWLRRLAYRLVHDQDLAEDLAQETIMTAMTHTPRVGAWHRPWLRTVMRNFLWRHLRTDVRRERRERGALEAPVPQQTEETLDLLRMGRLLGDLVEELEEPFRSTIVQRYMQGMSAADIARRQGVPPSTVRSRVALGLELLRKRLDERHDGNRRRWALALAPMVRPRPEAPVGATFATALLLVLVVAGAASWTRSRSTPPVTSTTAKPRATASAPAPLLRPVQAQLATVRVAGHRCVWDGGESDLGPVIGDGRPRLFVSRERLCQLRLAAREPDSTLGELFRDLQARVDEDRPDRFSVGKLNGARAYLAQAASLVYLVTAQPTYAQQAFRHLHAIYDDPGDEPTPERGYALARAKTVMALVMTHDWAATSLTDAQRRWLAERLERSIASWSQYQHAMLQPPFVSHWVPHARGAELISILALGTEKTTHQRRYEELKAILRTHLEGMGTTGLTPEGFTRLADGGTFLLPALFALRSAGDRDLEPSLQRTPFWKLLAFGAAFSPPGQTAPGTAFLPLGGLPVVGEEIGWASLLFDTVPDEDRPTYRWFYDRLIGATSGRSSNARFEAQQSGRVWALLHYPEQLAPIPSFERLGRSLVDDVRGAYLFRGSFRDQNDIQLALMGDFDRVPHVIDRSEPFALALHAFGTTFGGAGAGDSDPASTLLVDGRSFSDRRSTGLRGNFVPSPRGGYAVVDGSSAYRPFGLTSAERHLAVDFDDEGHTAVVATLDLLQAMQPHEYTWQLAPAPTGDLSIRTSGDPGRPGFVMDSPGGSVRGWLISPEGEVQPGPPLRVKSRARDAKIWVVMAISRSPVPAALVEGEGLEARVTLLGRTVRYDRGTGRIVIDPTR